MTNCKTCGGPKKYHSDWLWHAHQRMWEAYMELKKRKW